MASKAEVCVARHLRDALDQIAVGEEVAQSKSFREALNCLEHFIPEVLKERHPEWKRESLDGILPVVARKRGPNEMELFGHCILITDQSLTPIQLRIRASSETDEITWLECRLGERADDGMKRIPYRLAPPIGKILDAAEDIDAIDWCYAIAFGQKELS